MKLLNSKELQEMFGVSYMTIVRWRKEGMPHIKLGYNVYRFEADKVLMWARNKSKKNSKKQN